MTITTMQIVLIFIISCIVGIGSVLDEFQTHRPLIACTIIGLVLGDLKTGIIVGGILELIALGWINIGSALAPDAALASIISTIIIIAGEQDISFGIAIAIPIAASGQILTILARTLTVSFQKQADKFAQEENIKGIDFCHISALLIQALRVSIPAIIVTIFIGSDLVQNMLSSIPEFIDKGLQIGSRIVVVVGYATVINIIESKYLIRFLLIGFIVELITGLNLVSMTIIGIILIIFYVKLTPELKELSNLQKIKTYIKNSEFEDSKNINNKSYKKLTKSDLTQMFIRSNFLQGSWNFEKLQALGYCYSMIPAIKRFYTGEDRKKALKRHLEFFNTQPFMTGPILGVTALLEEQKANGIQISDDTIRDVKINLMKSLSDVGDKIFWGTLRPVIAAIGATLAVTGNILGPIIFFITLNIIRIWIKWWGIGYGYKKGIQIIDEISSIKLQNLIKSFSILGLFVMGVLINRRVNINIPIAISMINNITSLPAIQIMLNRLLSELLSLLCTFICIKLLKKKVSAIWIIFGIFILGIIGYGLGLLA